MKLPECIELLEEEEEEINTAFSHCAELNGWRTWRGKEEANHLQIIAINKIKKSTKRIIIIIKDST